jgi:hypothetical protein
MIPPPCNTSRGFLGSFSRKPHQKSGTNQSCAPLPCLIGITRSIAEQVLADYVFPFQPSGSKATDINEVAWTERLLHTMKFLDEKATQHLINVSGLKTA